MYTRAVKNRKALADIGAVTGASEICHIIRVQFPVPSNYARAWRRTILK